MGIVPNNLIQLQTMNRKALFWPLAAMLLTACEKGLDEGGEYMSPTAVGQVTNSVLQVRTRSASPGEEATVAYTKGTVLFVYFLLDFSDDAFADACQSGNLPDACTEFACTHDNLVAHCFGVVLQGCQIGDAARKH
jgi:hypothetical protein